MSTQEDQVEVKNNQAEQQYEIHSGEEVAVLAYERNGDSIAYLHTGVPESMEGHGIASKLARTALEEAREQHLAVVPYCPFVRTYIQRHPEYMSLLTEADKARFYPGR
jgi:predicted GNAT family acetyltransferase